MINFAAGLFIGLVFGFGAYRRKQEYYEGIIRDIYNGYACPDENGYVGTYRFPDEAQRDFFRGNG